MKERIKIIRPNSLKTISLLVASSLFVACGFYIMREDPIVAWGCILFFGLGVVVFLIQLMPNSSFLKLTKDGFEVKNLFKSDFTKWSDVDNFRAGNVGANRMVMFNYSGEHKKYKVGKKVSKFLSGNEGALPNTYGMKANELASLMNDWKSKVDF